MPAAAIPSCPPAICHKSSPDPFFDSVNNDTLSKKKNLAHFAARESMFLTK
jgi:hypothetical protein